MFWGEKPYHSLDYEMKQRFGEKVYRLSLNAVSYTHLDVYKRQRVNCTVPNTCRNASVSTNGSFVFANMEK